MVLHNSVMDIFGQGKSGQPLIIISTYFCFVFYLKLFGYHPNNKLSLLFLLKSSQLYLSLYCKYFDKTTRLASYGM